MSSNNPNPDTTSGWKAVARDYAAGLLSVGEICALHSVARSTLYYRAERDGWLLRTAGSAAAARAQGGGLGRRLLAALETKLARIESRTAGDATAESAADSERDARTLNTLVRLFEKLNGLGQKTQGDARPLETATNGIGPYDADRIRSELALRLEALRGQLGG